MYSGEFREKKTRAKRNRTVCVFLGRKFFACKMYLSSHLLIRRRSSFAFIHSVGSCNLDFFVCESCANAEVAAEFRSETRLNLASMKAKPSPRYLKAKEDKRLTYHWVHTHHIYFFFFCWLLFNYEGKAMFYVVHGYLYGKYRFFSSRCWNKL